MQAVMIKVQARISDQPLQRVKFKLSGPEEDPTPEEKQLEKEKKSLQAEIDHAEEAPLTRRQYVRLSAKEPCRRCQWQQLPQVAAKAH